MNLVNSAAQALNRPKLSGLPLYVLIDPYLGDVRDDGYNLAQITDIEVLHRVRCNAWDGRKVFHAPMKNPVISAYRLPYVVHIEENDYGVLDELVQMAINEHQSALNFTTYQRYRVGTIIETWMDPLDLMRRLEMMWSYHRPVEGARYLRIGDRRVFEAITHLFTPERLARWLGPIAHWHVLARDFRWLSVRGDDENWDADSGHGWRRAVDTTRVLEGASLQFDGLQRRRMRDLEAVARALLDWQRANRALSIDTYHLAWSAVAAAGDHGLVEQSDKAEFAYHWMRAHDCAPPGSHHRNTTSSNSGFGSFGTD